MSRYLLRSILPVGLFLILCGSPNFAMALSDNSAESPFYIAPKASFLLVDLPEYAPIAVRERSGGVGPWRLKDRIATEEGRLGGPRFGLTLGWNSPDSSLSGHPFFVEANGYASYMSNEQSSTIGDAAGNRVGWYPINGEYSAISHTEGVAVTSSRIVNQYGGEILVGIEIPLDDDWAVTPYFGYSGMYIDQRFDTAAKLLVGGANMVLQETISGLYNGVTGGARWKYSKDNIEWYASTSGAVQHVIAQYQGHQVDSHEGYDITHSDERSKFAVQGKIEAGVSYTINAWTVGVTSGAEYISAVPKIIASDKSSVYSFPADSTHVGWGSSMVYELGLKFSYHF